MARSAGALALGYRDFDPALNVAAVICNNVGSEKHALWVTEAVESIGLPVLGCVPRSPELRIPERHLGLHTAIERSAEVQAFLQHAAELVTQHIDLERMWQIARAATGLDIAVPEIEIEAGPLVRAAHFTPLVNGPIICALLARGSDRSSSQPLTVDVFTPRRRASCARVIPLASRAPATRSPSTMRSSTDASTTSRFSWPRIRLRIASR